MNDRRRSSDRGVPSIEDQLSHMAEATAAAADKVTSLASIVAEHLQVDTDAAAAKVTALAATVAEHLRIDAAYPPEHKQFVQMLIEERAERLARNKRIQEKIAGSVILTGALAFLAWLGHAALQSLQIIK